MSFCKADDTRPLAWYCLLLHYAHAVTEPFHIPLSMAAHKEIVSELCNVQEWMGTSFGLKTWGFGVQDFEFWAQDL